MSDRLYIVVPCYNEEQVLPATAERLKEKMTALIGAGTIAKDSRVLFVDDGSRDGTWSIIAGLNAADGLFEGVKLSRNRGHQSALLAGMYTATERADMIISMDADLQDDIGAVDEMLDYYYQGNDVVYGVRSRRDKDSFFKRTTAEGFYKVMQALGVDVVFNHADYRLMSKRAVEGLKQFREVNLFLRGIVPMVGYKSEKVYYQRGERLAGESKYPLKKMISFAVDGITSFSVKPLNFIFTAAAILIALGLAGLAVTITLTALNIIPFWGIILSAMALFTGIACGCLGIVGLYVGKGYMEVKHRPPYIIEEHLSGRDDSNG
ncbi:MAG TPA: glycosyltransferase family 2 protein [Candidatus Coproplasma avistercoris]|nr:glycosyltransferase family 2 protein [Candidatus Coproplasma avistercoris]